ncbi:MAG: heat-shock protein Hsp20 [Ardenticatenaceae bacterium]|nr:MAG: heat-shock protein Hsp20 [Ardenticatenaceae bacterium]
MTKVVRWNPMNPVSLMSEFDRLFERPYTRTASNWNIALDVAETEDSYLVEATIPGINVEDIEITLEDDVLMLKGEIQKEAEVEEAKYHLRERRYGRFSRSIRFPMDVNGDDVEATYANGVLSLNVPKAEAVKPKRITINAN